MKDIIDKGITCKHYFDMCYKLIELLLQKFATYIHLISILIVEDEILHDAPLACKVWNNGFHHFTICGPLS